MASIVLILASEVHTRVCRSAIMLMKETKMYRSKYVGCFILHERTRWKLCLCRTHRLELGCLILQAILALHNYHHKLDCCQATLSNSKQTKLNMPHLDGDERKMKHEVIMSIALAPIHTFSSSI